MKDFERFGTIASVSDTLDECMSDLIVQADILEEEGYEEFGEKVREIAGQLDDLSHEIYQRNKKDNH